VELFDCDAPNRKVISVWTPRDRPPIVGAYLYSSVPLKLDDPVSTVNTQAFRRIGRTTRQIDFLWLRGLLAEDPDIRIDSKFEWRTEDGQLLVKWKTWHAGGGPALHISLSSAPSFAGERATHVDLPMPNVGNVLEHELGFSLSILQQAGRLEVPS